MHAVLYSLALLASAHAAATPGDALAAYSLQHYDEAYREWQALAAAGSSDAEFYLGLLYETGRGVAQDMKRATDCYMQAAAAGQARAAYRLSRLARQTDDLKADSKADLKWLRQAAEGGVADAQYELGALLAEGRVVAPDLAAAEDWLKRAAAGFDDPAKRQQAAHMRQMVAARLHQ